MVTRHIPSKPSLPANSSNGALSSPNQIKEVISPAAPRKSQAAKAESASIHQTHGAYTPPTGPITNVSQLTRGRVNLAKGEAGGFSTMAEYTAYLRTLSLGEIHSHAVKEKIVPIDDRERLIRRLETQWTTTAARYPGRTVAAVNQIPRREPFTREQIEAQEAIKNKMLKR